MSGRVLLVVLAVLPLIAAPTARAQIAPAPVPDALAPQAGPRRPAPIAPGPQEGAPVPTLLAAGSSLVLPGMGQLLLGQRRWTAYAGLELAGWLVHLDQAREGRRSRNTYRDLAWVAARGMSQPREEGEWAYYEALGSWTRSGAFDADEGQSGLQPETSAESYNGEIWELARDLYLPEGAGPTHPAYARALEYYRARAIQPGFLWDWSGREESLQLYRDLIDESDEALRTATVVFGAVVANHLFSAVDAFVSSRLGRTAPVSASALWRELPAGTVLEWSVRIRP